MPGQDVPRDLPIVDISPFLPSSTAACATPARRRACAAAIHAACLQFGFFYISCTGLSPDALDRPLQVAREFFARPTQEKAALRIRPHDGARGYQLLGENVTQYQADHHEGWDAYAPFPAALLPTAPSATLTGENVWPIYPPAFRPTMEDWVEKMKVLGMALLEATAMGLGVAMDGDGEEWTGLRRLVEESFWVMRAIAYPPLPGDAPGISCGVHAGTPVPLLSTVDSHLTPILNQITVHTDSTPGALQVFLPVPSADPLYATLQPDPSARGLRGKWLNADPVPGCFVVNIGEMWEIWSNGLYKATLHRVIHKGTNQRISLPFFSEPNFDALIQPLAAALRLQKERGQGEDTERRKPVVYGDFLRSKVEGNFGFVEGSK